MRFWVKGKQGEKKTPREKLTTPSELLELYAEQEEPGIEMIPGLQLGEGKGARKGMRQFSHATFWYSEGLQSCTRCSHMETQTITILKLKG